MPAFVVPPESKISMACKFETHKPLVDEIPTVTMCICDLSNKQCVHSFSCVFALCKLKWETNLVQDNPFLLWHIGGKTIIMERCSN